MIKAKQTLDPERERRIAMEIVVDSTGHGLVLLLTRSASVPFTAICIDKRSISPLRVKDEVEAIGLPGEEECEHEMFVTIRWEKEGLAVPLSQLKLYHATDKQTKQEND